MDKIHTHYDNLKVARGAPPEVIRAAYKALSQKYHPDKNPGDEKAARIMAILNSAYGTLADAQRRKEHDEWIAAEEWEIEWLESTRSDDSREKNRSDESVAHWANTEIKLAPYRPSRDPKWWVILISCIGIGWLGAVLMQAEPDIISMALSGNVKPKTTIEQTPSVQVTPVNLTPAAPELPPQNQIIAISQIRMPDIKSACDADAPMRTPVAPNGETWPAKSAYIEGYKVENVGGYTQIIVDNSNNGADIYVSLFDNEKNRAVRHLLVSAHAKFTLGHLNAGNYEVRYEALGFTERQKLECKAPKKDDTAAN